MPPTDPNSGKPPEKHSDQHSLPVFDLPSEGEIDLGVLQPTDDDVVSLALPEPPSGQSLTSWTEIIRRQQIAGTANGADAVKVDAPSDRDLLARLDALAPPAKSPPGDTSEIPEAQLPIYAPPALPTGHSESDIDLGPGLAPAGHRTGESEIKFDIMYPPSDAAGAMPFPTAPPLSSVDFRAATAQAAPPADEIPFAAVPGPDASGIDLAKDDDDDRTGETGRSSILDVLLKETGASPASESADVLNFGVAPAKPAKPARPTVPTADRPVVGTQPGIDMAAPPEVGGRELVGSNPDMGSDESIDLLAEPAEAPNITDSGTLEISEEAVEENKRRTEILESSSVDLNSKPAYAGPGSEFDVALEALPGDSESDSDINMNLPASEEPGSSSMISGHAEVHENAKELAAEFEAIRKTRHKPEREPQPEPKPDTRKLPPTKAVKKSPRPVLPARREAPRSSRRSLIFGAAFGMVFGAGGLLAAYSAGALPDRKERGPVVVDNSFQLVKLKEDVDAARKEAKQAKADVDLRVAEATSTRDARINNLSREVQRAESLAAVSKKAADDAVKARQAAEKTAVDATTQVTEATRARTIAEASLGAARKEAADAQKAATEVKTAAEAKEKEAAALLAAATKKVADLTALADSAQKSADEARKAAEEAVRTRDASDATVKAIADRLARAKFVADKADATALLRGIDDALKAGTGDATQALRDELATFRQQEAKAKADLVAAREREAEATRAAAATKADAQRLTTDLARAKAENDRLIREATAAAGKVGAAETAVAELARLKVENDRLTRDLEAVKELAELIKSPAVALTGPPTKPDPARLGEQFFGDGLRAYHGARYTEAESAFRKAIQFRPTDARYHYLLGLTLWARNDTPGAEAEFEKGRDLELQSRPSSRVVGAALEKIQGSARQAVDAYRP
jgi:hypothetical protein